jgi:hypothetical protein
MQIYNRLQNISKFSESTTVNILKVDGCIPSLKKGELAFDHLKFSSIKFDRIHTFELKN